MLFTLNRHAVIQEAQNIGIRRTHVEGDCADEGTSHLGEWFSVEIQASGFEPSTKAAEAARAKGFDVRCGWSLHEADFTEGGFAAVTAIDVLCLVWDPTTTLQTFYRLLKPGGVLAMRLTNKRFILGLARAVSTEGTVRDAFQHY